MTTTTLRGNNVSSYARARVASFTPRLGRRKCATIACLAVFSRTSSSYSLLLFAPSGVPRIPSNPGSLYIGSSHMISPCTLMRGVQYVEGPRVEATSGWSRKARQGWS